MKIYKYLNILFLCLTTFFYISCSGYKDEEIEHILELKADKKTIDANGKKIVSFKVLYDSQDITDKSKINCLSNNTLVKDASFYTDTQGEYSFQASYNGITSNIVNIMAEQVIISAYKKEICAMEFTGCWCSNCPSGMTNLKYIIDTYYSDIVHILCLHCEDIFEIQASNDLVKQFKVSGYPHCVIDMRDVTGLTGLSVFSSLRSYFDNSIDDHPAYCGGAIESYYDEKSSIASINVRITSEKTANYRLALYIVEDGIKYKQNDGGIEKENYMHNHVARQLLSKTINGDNIGEIKKGEEKTFNYSAKINSQWNLDNISVYALFIDQDGIVNNMTLCKILNDKTDYNYSN